MRKVAFLSDFPVNCAPVQPLLSYLHTRCAVEACVIAESCSDWLSGTAAELSLSFGSRKQRLMSHRPHQLCLDFPEILTIEFLPGISFADPKSVIAVWCPNYSRSLHVYLFSCVLLSALSSLCHSRMNYKSSLWNHKILTEIRFCQREFRVCPDFSRFRADRCYFRQTDCKHPV